MLMMVFVSYHPSFSLSQSEWERWMDGVEWNEGLWLDGNRSSSSKLDSRNRRWTQIQDVQEQACRSRDENCEMKIRKIASGQSSFGQTEELTRGANSLMIPEGAKGERDRDRILDLNPRDWHQLSTFPCGWSYRRVASIQVEYGIPIPLPLCSLWNHQAICSSCQLLGLTKTGLASGYFPYFHFAIFIPTPTSLVQECVFRYGRHQWQESAVWMCLQGFHLRTERQKEGILVEITGEWVNEWSQRKKKQKGNQSSSNRLSMAPVST